MWKNWTEVFSAIEITKMQKKYVRNQSIKQTRHAFTKEYIYF